MELNLKTNYNIFRFNTGLFEEARQKSKHAIGPGTSATPQGLLGAWNSVQECQLRLEQQLARSCIEVEKVT